MALLQILLFCFFMNLSYSQTDTIFQGQQLRDGDVLESANKDFKLQFFSLDSNKTHYLGIFYNLPSGKPLFPDDYRPVWVANRDNPIPDSSGNLTIDSDGKLKIFYGSDNFVLLSSFNASSRNTSATLLDNGNFVLSELNGNGSVNGILWQSFDYPTDTFLPGMKIGKNLKTGHTWLLNSWISEQVPATGSFSIGIDTNDMDQLKIWWQGRDYWRSGRWGNGSFSNVVRDSHYDYVELSFVSTEDEKYLTYSVNENLTISRYVIDPFGFIKERGAAGPFGVCFYKPSAGCVTVEPLECPRNDTLFERMPNSVDGISFKYENNNMSLFDCKKQCEKNCSCAAFASITTDGTGCEVWRNVSSSSLQSRNVFVLDTGRDLVPARDGRSTNGSSTHLPFPDLTPTPSPNSIQRSSKAIKLWVWLTATISVTILIGFSSLCYLLHRKGKAKATVLLLLNKLKAISSAAMIFQRAKRSSIRNVDKKIGHEVQLYSFESLNLVTDHFSPRNKLGEGGFGPVYKGEFPDGQKVAIKRLSTSSGQGLLEFKNEILLIAKLQHTNLVRLLGCCTQGEERILVYEYMQNRSLDFFLFDNSKKELLNWSARLNVIEGVAQGLLYLHIYSRVTVIHRDLKASNILLDDTMNPKISDFGLARIFGRQESEANTKRIVGTHGYMSPEYALRGIVSTKTDVFSFGVLLLEIVSGKKNNSCYDSEHPLNLIGLAWELWREDRALELIDVTLIESCSRDEVIKCIHVGLLCVQDHAKDRPSMLSVVSMLTNRQPPPPPQQPGFFIERGEQKAEISEEVERYSMNGLSISELKAR